MTSSKVVISQQVMTSSQRIISNDNAEFHPPTLQVCASAMLALQIVTNKKLRVLSGLQWHNSHTKINENQFSCSQVVLCVQKDRQTK
jgi:hypothetical protein